MSVHNEQDNLRYTLPPLFSADPDEIIFVLDRCRDRSKGIIKAAVERLGFYEARNDAILIMAADIIIDKRIRE